MVTLVAILNFALCETYYGCRLSFANYHSIMLNKINNFQDGQNLQNGRQIED